MLKRSDEESVTKHKPKSEYTFKTSQIFNGETSCYADIYSCLFKHFYGLHKT